MPSGKITEVYVDGASRGNPGESGIGVLVIRPDSGKKEIREYIGKGTNNEAEYKALIKALGYLAAEGGPAAKIHTDSQLVASQMNGLWKVKDSRLKLLYSEAKRLASRLPALEIEYIPRENNTDADRLANEAIDRYFND
ncbi:MAG: ribonuclease HI family protein [Candidatus Dadabacteria bacterium]|nr:ribonuclease HI family protein [Candidatus Dadabacteria bacterium]MYC40550.1 ribonuclease HI family protein [Candidatus Dadabacteria bacterium]MYH39567.1 ribonuclease HI family protein [Candidatus Dadabacteria bacterium]